MCHRDMCHRDMCHRDMCHGCRWHVRQTVALKRREAAIRWKGRRAGLLHPRSPSGDSGLAQDAGRVRRPRAVCPPVERSAFAGFQFPPEVITLAVRWYLRYSLSHGTRRSCWPNAAEVDHVTIYRWVRRFTRLFADAA
jgi:hypothetical protein